LPAPFVDPAVAEVVAAADEDEDADDLEVTAVVIVWVPVAVAGVAALAEVVPPIGAVDWPSISAWREELNDPDMPAKVNLAENASA